jgi:hypothetical protein
MASSKFKPTIIRLRLSKRWIHTREDGLFPFS